MREVAAIGLGMHPWGKFPDKSVTQLCREAVEAALADAGMRWSEIEAVASASLPDPNDAALLSAADELHDSQAISAETWSRLRAHYDEAQLIEIVFTVGQYTMLSMLTNSLRIELEPGLPGFPAGRRRTS